MTNRYPITRSLSAWREELESSSLYELFRLRMMLDCMLDDPKKIAAVHQKIYPQQKITYFDRVKNQEISATVQRLGRKKVTVINDEDRACWQIPYVCLNLSGVMLNARQSKDKIDRLTLKVGDAVGFIHSRTHEEYYGNVIRLNTKTATVQVVRAGRIQRWRVRYSSLFYVTDTTPGWVELESV